MPIHLYLNAHQKAQLGRFVRLVGSFLVTSGVADAAINSSWLRALIGGSGAALLEVLYRQVVKVQPPRTLLAPGGPVPAATPVLVGDHGPETVVIPPTAVIIPNAVIVPPAK